MTGKFYNCPNLLWSCGRSQCPYQQKLHLSTTKYRNFYRRSFWRIDAGKPTNSKHSRREYIKRTYFRVYIFSQISRIWVDFAKLNAREIFFQTAFAKINTREIEICTKFIYCENKYTNKTCTKKLVNSAFFFRINQ